MAKVDKKLTLHVMIEGGRAYTDEFNDNQKLQVVVNKTVSHFSLTDENKRKLLRGDGSELKDYKVTLEEAGIRENETLKFILKEAPKPEEPKKFA